MATIPIPELLTLTLISQKCVCSLFASKEILLLTLTTHYIVCIEEWFFVGRYISH